MNREICALKRAHEEELKTADDIRKDEIRVQWAQIFTGLNQIANIYKDISDVAFHAAVRFDRKKTPF